MQHRLASKMIMNDSSLPEFTSSSIFLVWGTPDQGPRSKVMARKLGIEAHFISTGLPRGVRYVPIKYTIQAFRTLQLLFGKQPKVIFVQNPPLLAVLISYVYCLFTHAGFIIDAHSEAMLAKGWTAPPTWIKRFLARKAIATIVTNEHLEKTITDWGGRAIIIRDIPTVFTVNNHFAVSDQFNIALINTFAKDEPLESVLKAAGSLPDVHFYVTGRKSTKNPAIIDMVNNASSNVHFTDFLVENDYYGLLNSVEAVMCLTLRDHTMQRGACEALSLGKPIITSNWTMLCQYFNKGTVHVENTVDGIRLGVIKMQENYPSYSKGIRDLQTEQQHEWDQKVIMLYNLIQSFLLKVKRAG